MRIILYSWSRYYEKIMIKGLVDLGHDVYTYSKECRHYTRDVELAQELIGLIQSQNIEAVISYNYFPIISMVCNTTGIQYYSWVFDSPHHTLFARTVAYKCNHIGCFDKDMTRYLNDTGYASIRHVALGNAWSVKSQKDKRFCCDISFVGGLYTNKYDYYDNITLPEDLQAEADRCVKRQVFQYRQDEIEAFFHTPDVMNEEMRMERLRNILAAEGLLPGEDYEEDIKYIFRTSVLEKKVTVEERRSMLEGVAHMDCDFRLYTESDLSGYPDLKRVNRGHVDYNTEMPYVFRNSRINLNLTLRSIHTGIPQRAIDIMGCGGFLLSNYQEELSELFKENEEFVSFDSLKECEDKIRYYLKHEDERKKIALAGEKAVGERLDYRHQLRKLIDG